jgi:tetratricopeptide (TPR) repeat protein
MKNNHEIDYAAFIERYLDREMSQDEQLWFARELKGNLSLNKELKLREEVNYALAETEVMAFRNQLDAIFEEKNISIHKKSYKPVRRKVAFISSFAAALSLILLLWFTHRNYNNAEIYKRYFSPAEAGFTFRAEGTFIDDDLRMAMQYYEAGNYEQALTYFEKILNADKSRVGINLYSGISQMELEKYNDARKSFSQIIDNNYILYLEQAEWYLAFCYLMTDEKEKAVEQFALIENRKGYYQKQARKILRRIR